MTEYKSYRIKEADICNCKHVRGSHAGKHFGLSMLFMAATAGTMIPLGYLVKFGIISDVVSAIIWGAIMAIMIPFVLFKFDKGCSFCTCKKFEDSGYNEYEREKHD